MQIIIKASIILSVFVSTLCVAQTQISTEEFNLINDSISLPGTLSYNKNLEKQVLVIYIHGSGNVDRNGNQGGIATANYIKQLSEALNQKSIAFYRYDKRTATQENRKFLMQGVSFDDFVEDVKVAIEHFKDDSRFSEIVLIGHSQGSLIGMLAMSVHVNKYISLAGPASSIDKIMTEQIRNQNGDAVAGIVESHFEELSKTGSIEKVNPMLFQLFNSQNLVFFKSWMKYSPQEEIAKLQLPVLIINGTKDLQVPVEEAESLHTANSNSTLIIIENMNHVLKYIEKDEDNIASYTSPEFPLSIELVNAISKFINE